VYEPDKQPASQAAPAEWVGKVPARHTQHVCLFTIATTTTALFVYIFWIVKGRGLPNKRKQNIETKLMQMLLEISLFLAC